MTTRQTYGYHENIIDIKERLMILPQIIHYQQFVLTIVLSLVYRCSIKSELNKSHRYYSGHYYIMKIL